MIYELRFAWLTCIWLGFLDDWIKKQNNIFQDRIPGNLEGYLWNIEDLHSEIFNSSNVSLVTVHFVCLGRLCGVVLLIWHGARVNYVKSNLKANRKKKLSLASVILGLFLPDCCHNKIWIYFSPCSHLITNQDHSSDSSKTMSNLRRQTGNSIKYVANHVWKTKQTNSVMISFEAH